MMKWMSFDGMRAVTYAARLGYNDVQCWAFVQIVCARGLLDSPGQWSRIEFKDVLEESEKHDR